MSDGKGGAVTKLCPAGLCCSQYGYCGDTVDHCDKGCQAGVFVQCYAGKVPQPHGLLFAPSRPGPPPGLRHAFEQL